MDGENNTTMIGGTQVHIFQADEISDNERATYMQRALELSNKAHQAGNQGNHTEAERLHTEALNLKLIATGPDSITYALSANALAETQIKVGKWDDAEKNLINAVRIRDTCDEKPFDAAVSRDLLGQVYEYRGDLIKARETRVKFPNKTSCSNYECPTPHHVKLADLKQCGRCGCAFYCTPICQKKDWKRHKQFCKAL